MSRAPGDLLQLLANPTNRGLLGVLAVEPQYTRRLSELVGLTEEETSRRLRAFEKLGLVDAEWANVGKTVRMYRLAASRFTVTVGPNGLAVGGLADDKPLELGAVAEAPPVVEHFVGRADELAALAELVATRRAVCVHGIGGAGKTTLAAEHAARSGRPVVWHTLTPSESGNLLLARLAAGAGSLGADDETQRLLQLRSGDEGALLLDAIAEVVEARAALVVLDRFEVAGEGAGDVAGELARRLRRGALIVTSRAFPREFRRDVVASLPLMGLSREDTAALLDARGAAAAEERADEVYARTLGHPLAVVLVALAARSAGGGSVDGLLAESGIRDFLIADVLPQLTEGERETLLAVSVLREPFMAEEAEQVSGSRHARDALLRLVARGLATRAGDTFALHDLVRAFAYEAAPNRRQAHARAAAALRESGEPAKVLEALHHLLEAGKVSDAAALAREEVTRRPYRFADVGLADRWREALDRLEAMPALKPAERAVVAMELAVLEAVRGEFERARARIEAAAPGAKAAKLDVPLSLARARVLRAEGRTEEAVPVYEATEAALAKAGDRHLLLDALLEHAFVLDELGRAGAEQLYQRAAEAARDAGDLRALSIATAGVARFLVRAGAPEGQAVAEEALRLARLAGYLRGESAVYMMMSEQAHITGRFTVGIETAERHLHIADRLGDAWLRACALGDIAYHRLGLDEGEEAVKAARAAYDAAAAVKSKLLATGAAVALGSALNRLGRFEEALEVMGPHLALLETEPEWGWGVNRHGWEAAAAAYRATGRASEARAAEERAARAAKSTAR